MMLMLRVFLVFGLILPAIAQSDYVYLMNDQISRKTIVSLVMNSRGYRELPNSPYRLQHFDEVNLKFQSSVIFSEPGKFLYFSRLEPDQIYGFRRLLDGSLEPLPNFPIDLPSIRRDNIPFGGIIALEKHPYLPVFYSIQTFDDLIRAWRVLPDGQVEALPNSPFFVGDEFLLGLQGFAMTQDGTTFFVNTFAGNVIFRGNANPKSGVIENIEGAYEHFQEGREALLTENDEYLFTTQAVSPIIGRYRVQDGQLERLLPDFIAPHDVAWLWRKGNLIVSGATGPRQASTFLIQPDGTLQLGANSPFDVFSNTLWYADFSPSRDRVYFGGNSFMQVYDIGPNGLMTLAPNSGFPVHGWGFGISVAPEIRGDPYGLSFIQPQGPDEPFRIQGDPDTVFYLQVNDQCEGPYITDSNGFFTTAYPRIPDQELQILAYCDETNPADRVVTVPTLSRFGMLMLILLLLALSLPKINKLKRSPNVSISQ